MASVEAALTLRAPMHKAAEKHNLNNCFSFIALNIIILSLTYKNRRLVLILQFFIMMFYCVGLVLDASEFSIRWFYGRKFNKKYNSRANFHELFFAFNA